MHRIKRGDFGCRASAALTAGVFASALIGGSVAQAADQLLVGKKFILGDSGKRNVLKLLAKDREITVDPADEPDVAGLTVRVKNPVTLEEGSIELPASGWTRNRSGTTFKFKDASLGKALVRNGRQITLNLRDTLISLDEAEQGTLALVLSANASRWCFLFDPFSVKQDKPCKFKAKKAAAPVECIDPPLGSPSGAFLEVQE